MSNTKEAILTNLDVLFQETDKALNEWLEERNKMPEKERSNLKFPKLMEKMTLSLNWSDDQVHKNDPIVRYYLRDHKDWHFSVGAKGGIQPASDRQNKEAIKAAKEAARIAVEIAIAAKQAAKEQANVVEVTDEVVAAE